MMPYLPACAATDKAHGAGLKSGAVSEFPGEYPTNKELSDWLDLNLPLIEQVYGAVLNDEVPSQLVHLKSGVVDVTGYTEIVAGTPAAADMSAAKVAEFNHKARAAKAARKAADASCARNEGAQEPVGTGVDCVNASIGQPATRCAVARSQGRRRIWILRWRRHDESHPRIARHDRRARGDSGS